MSICNLILSFIDFEYMLSFLETDDGLLLLASLDAADGHLIVALPYFWVVGAADFEHVDD